MSSSTFQPEWFTIPEFAHTQPLCMYHKESEGMPSDGCTAGTQADSRGNLHVLARAEYLWESGDIPGARAVMRITAVIITAVIITTVIATKVIITQRQVCGPGTCPCIPGILLL